jgi:histidyl-tRNA synthetase
VQSNLGGGSFKSQFKRADRSGAPLAMILAENELRNGEVTIKHLRDDAGQQQVPLGELGEYLRSRVNASDRK